MLIRGDFNARIGSEGEPIGMGERKEETIRRVKRQDSKQRRTNIN